MIIQTNVTRPMGEDTNYFVCGYCGTGCWHGTYCGCDASRKEVGRYTAPLTPAESMAALDAIELVF